MSPLFRPLNAGTLELPNRIVMAPLTRARATRTHIPNDLLVEYYAQRASAGLLITEATMIAPDGCAFTAEGGLFDDTCVAGWRRVTDEVHRRGGRIAVQLWHPGRAAHSALNGGTQPISSTDRAIRNDTIRVPDLGPQPYETPRRLHAEELPGIVQAFAAAARRALAAGFDGVQIHGAHGYLLDQFLRDSVNDRHDHYGGSIPNRARLLLESVDAAIGEVGAGRVSVRISPLVGYNDISDSDPDALVAYLADEFQGRGIGFLELRHAQHDAPAERALARLTRKHFHGPLILNGGFDRASASQAIDTGVADAIAFGRAYIANPDLVERFAAGAPLNTLDPSTLYTPGAHGYTDYPTLSATAGGASGNPD
jgi:N-ethylmaleimide reductase